MASDQEVDQLVADVGLAEAGPTVGVGGQHELQQVVVVTRPLGAARRDDVVGDGMQIGRVPADPSFIGVGDEAR